MPSNDKYNTAVERAWDTEAFGYVPATAARNPYGVGYLRAPGRKSTFVKRCMLDGYPPSSSDDAPFATHVRYVALYPVMLFRNGRVSAGRRLSHGTASRADPRLVVLHGRATRDDPRQLLRSATGQGDDGVLPDDARRALWANAQWNPHALYDPPWDLSGISVIVYMEQYVIAGGYLVSKARDDIRLRAYGLGQGDRWQQEWSVQTREAVAHRASSTMWYARIPALLYARPSRADAPRSARAALLTSLNPRTPVPPALRER
jgi:hypothetical protein